MNLEEINDLINRHSDAINAIRTHLKRLSKICRFLLIPEESNMTKEIFVSKMEELFEASTSLTDDVVELSQINMEILTELKKSL